VATIALTRDSIRENDAVEFEEGCRLAEIPAEPGMGRPGTCGGGDSSRPVRPARKVTFTYDWTQLTDEKYLPQDAWPGFQESAGYDGSDWPHHDGLKWPRCLVAFWYGMVVSA
jgi:hypothetical protein